jgi:hypothetical protein
MFAIYFRHPLAQTGYCRTALRHWHFKQEMIIGHQVKMLWLKQNLQEDDRSQLTLSDVKGHRYPLSNELSV